MNQFRPTRREVICSSVAALLPRVVWGQVLSGGDKITAALARAGDYLIGVQSEDGSWRSGVHGVFREGTGLTPQVLIAMQAMAGGDERAKRSVGRGIEYLLSLTNVRGELAPPDRQLSFPVYTTAQVISVLSTAGGHEPVIRGWVSRLRERQLSAEQGWRPADPGFGGWGYSPMVPRKPADGQMSNLPLDANLSATTFALEALRSARVPADDAIWRDALTFVDRCQNFSEKPAASDPSFDDGGFYFSPTDAARNKPGAAGIDPSRRERFHSYGSMTADGLRAMLLCGRASNHPRVLAARQWLQKHFDPARNPGKFNSDREFLRESSYYYWASSAAATVARLPSRTQSDALARELVGRQRPDGSWANAASGVKEDDPLVATPFAVMALCFCRRAI